MMNHAELCTWLRENSSGIYRPAAEAADEMERMREALNVAAGALWRLSPAVIEDDDDRAAAEHARSVGLAACESILKNSA